MTIITYLFLGSSILMGQSEEPPEPIIKEFTPAGRIEALIDGVQEAHLVLVQLDLKNDSLFNLVNNILTPSITSFDADEHSIEFFDIVPSPEKYPSINPFIKLSGAN